MQVHVMIYAHTRTLAQEDGFGDDSCAPLGWALGDWHAGATGSGPVTGELGAGLDFSGVSGMSTVAIMVCACCQGTVRLVEIF
jgi:hypothetical protein